MSWIHMITTRRVSVAAFVAVLAASVQAPAQFTADGNLHDEILLALTDADGNGVPDILDAHDSPGIAFRYVDTTAEASGFHPAGNEDGMSDEPSSNAFVPFGICQDLRGYVRVPTNHGKVTVIYLMDSTGTLTDGDDSIFYIGIDICNGDQYSVAGDLEFGADGLPHLPAGAPLPAIVDYELPIGVNRCEYGLPVEELSPFDFLNFMVPFDADGDGHPLTTTRLTADGGLPEDDDERYKVRLFACAGLPQEAELIRLELRANTFTFGENVAFFVNDVPAPDPSAFPHHPFHGTGPDTIASWGDARFAQPGNQDLAILDLEFIIPGIDSIVDARYPADDYETVNRFRLAQGAIKAFSDSDGDLANEDLSDYSWLIPIPQIEVTKEIRCVETGEPNAPNEWRETADALPGAQLEFRITVENTGNVDLAVELTDLLEGAGIEDIDCDSLLVELTRPSDPAQNGIVDYNNAGTKDPPFSQDFFDVPFIPGCQGFLTSLDGTPICLGVLTAVGFCADGGPFAGDTVVITFTATIPDDVDYCTDPQEEDVRNSVTASGDPDFTLPNPCPLAPDGDEVSDEYGVIDTYREGVQGFDDNVVTANVLCRDVTFEKDVALCTDCGDPDTCGPFADELVILPGTPYPLCVGWRYTVTNDGEVDEEVTLSDPFLCTDVAAVGGAIVYCDVCPDPAVFTVPAGGQVTRYCLVELTEQQLLDLVAIDDGTSRPCPLDDPPGVDDPDCYSNCAEMRANVTNLGGICDGAPEIELKDYATICTTQCRLIVAKEVTCIDQCGPDGVIPPGFGYGPSVEVVPGSCVRFRVTITNDPDNPGVCDACKLVITDCLGLQPNQITFQDNVVFDLNGTPCSTPAGFNVDCNSFEWFPSDCGMPGFGLGDALTFTFDAQIPLDADCNAPDDIDAQNTVLVGGFIECPGEPAFEPEQAEVTVDIKCVGLDCLAKEWSVLWDSDGDSQPGPGFIDYSDFHDLGTANGGEAIIFPAKLCLRVTVQNTGEVDKDVTVEDQDLFNAVNTTDGVSFDSPPPCELDVTKTIPAGGTETWECCIRVETADAMRDLAANDAGSDPNAFENCADVDGTPIGVCPGPGSGDECCATIIPPPLAPCELSVTIDCEVIEIPGGEGCTPGYWKNHLDMWPSPYQPGDDFDATFGVDAFDPDITLEEAVNLGGGGVNALARHAVAALLNAAREDVDYALTEAGVIALVQAALAPGGDIEGTKNQLEGHNEEGCPLGNDDGEDDGGGNGRDGPYSDECCFPPGGVDVEYSYTVTNTGLVTVTNITVVDDVFGVVPGSPIASLDPGQSAALTLTQFIAAETTNTVTVAGESVGGQCEATDSLTIGPCGEACLLEVTIDCLATPPPAGEGCTPGYWKNHLDMWPDPYQPGDDFDATFGVDAFDPNITLEEAVNLGGGGVEALARHAVAALLNAAREEVDYALAEAEVIALVQAALAPGGDVEGTKNQLEGHNEEGCPLDGGGGGEGPGSGECCVPSGGADIEFAYTVTNSGPVAVTNVTVADSFGEVPGSPIDSLEPNEAVTLTRTEFLTEATTNTVTASGEASGSICAATNTVCIPLCADGSCCDNGKLRVLTMRYTGDACDATQHSQGPCNVSCDGDPTGAAMVRIRASDSPDPGDDYAMVWFDGIVWLNQTFDIDAANAGESKLMDTTFIHVFDPADTLLQTIEFHTSCSQPLNRRDQFGSALLLYCVCETCGDCFGELTGDGGINLDDVAQLICHYGMTSGAEYVNGDLDGDGDVDLADLAELLGRYGRTCE